MTDQRNKLMAYNAGSANFPDGTGPDNSVNGGQAGSGSDGAVPNNSVPNSSEMAFVICAPSGTGKTTLAARLLGEFPALRYSVSCTTRAPRPAEINGKDYYFISKENFAARRANNEFIEWAEVHGNYYGTLGETVKEALAGGNDLLFDIDVQGAAQVRLNLPGECAFAFLAPPSIHSLRQRLNARASDSEETIARRVANARGELANAHWFDFVIVNDNLEQAYAELRAAYLAAKLSPKRRAGLINKLLTE